MFRNRHVVTALLVTPVLAIIAWGAVGKMYSEQPAPARAGTAYPLVEKSGCRYAGGLCELENHELRLVLREKTAAGPVLAVESSHALDSVHVSVAAPDEQPGPRVLRAADSAGRVWELDMVDTPGPPQRLRLVAVRSGSAFYAEASTHFLLPQDAVE